MKQKTKRVGNKKIKTVDQRMGEMLQTFLQLRSSNSEENAKELLSLQHMEDLQGIIADAVGMVPYLRILRLAGKYSEDAYFAFLMLLIPSERQKAYKFLDSMRSIEKDEFLDFLEAHSTDELNRICRDGTIELLSLLPKEGEPKN